MSTPAAPPEAHSNIPERLLGGLQSSIQKFVHLEVAGGLVLVVCSLLAMGWANSPWHESYHSFWHTPVSIAAGPFSLSNSLQHWINDGLMVIFFFVIGLEVKREVLVGELSSPRRAILPIAAALGGMLVPAGIYLLFTKGTPSQHGWGIPTATDIAFSLGILSIFGKRVPVSLKVFLTALAIADDLGAIVVIALFYGGEIQWLYLGCAMGFFALLLFCNVAGVRSILPYALFGIGGIWLGFLQSGIHATLAGIFAAMAIPARQVMDQRSFAERCRHLVQSFLEPARGPTLQDEQSQAQIEELLDLADRVDTPLSRLERRLHPWVAFGILPVFALANAGVTLGGGQELAPDVLAGIVLGLLLGKPIGITLASWLAVKSGYAEKPADMSWPLLHATAWLAGIGFTMSLFVANLAFKDAAHLETGKIAILCGSTAAGFCGSLILGWQLRRAGR